jgi:ribosomal-protein-alanine N-acetyltransferase
METQRCRLAALQESDFEFIKKLYANEDVRRFLGGIVVEERILREKFFEQFLRCGTDSLYWIIKSKQDGEYIGVVSLGKHHDGINTEVSYQLLPEWWGEGYAYEAVDTIINYAFQELGLLKVIAETQTANKSSCRLLERVGMKIERTIQRFGAEQGIYGIEK